MFKLRNFCFTAVFVLFSVLAFSIASAQEVTLQKSDESKLDPFEQQNLARADKLFADKQYRAAMADYDLFLLEFPKSAALPYALLRKSRSIELDNKRYQAIKSYQEVLDYFPNHVAYAAPALFYIGDCHWSNGNTKNALIAWSKM
ncbi:MAG: tetratricopeptide repeat protein, partial [Lentisphaerae bacterium]|nr:tetratricopeptide repeat protein [Lentisphaerota bacterium]